MRLALGACGRVWRLLSFSPFWPFLFLKHSLSRIDILLTGHHAYRHQPEFVSRLAYAQINSKKKTRPSPAMLELDPMNELEFFRITNSIFFAKGSTVFLCDISSNNSPTLRSCSISCSSPAPSTSLRNRQKGIDAEIRRRVSEFLSISLSVNKEGDEFAGDPNQLVEGNGGSKGSDESVVAFREFTGKKEKTAEEKRARGSGAFNTTKHLWSGAVAAMVSRTFIAPLERMKLEYIVRGEQRHLSELIKTIAAREGIKGFWKGNFINILRTAPFKAINFYAYDTYRSQLLKLSGNEETTNFERFVAGAAAGITATLLCLPMDTIRTIMVAPGGEALGGLIGAFRHVIRTEGFFSLYKGLVPSVVSMAPSGAVFYGVYDILKTSYLHSPEGKQRLENMKQGIDLNALDQLELGPVRTLIYGAIAGACSEAATYPFEVVRRHLQLQVRETKLSALATCVKIVEQGGVPALYAGLIPSILQVLPSAAISYFVYEFMKVVLKVESQ